MGKKAPPEPPGAPAWMMTFSDITTLLLTFFILIMTFSTVEKEKFEKARGSFKGAFGVVSADPMRSRPQIQSRRLNLYDRVRREGAESPRRVEPDKLASELFDLAAGEEIVLDKEETRWRIRFPTAYAFQPGRATVRRRIVGVYAKIARTLHDYPNVIVLEGHTDGAFVPSSLYATPWELAGARAAAVASIFIRAGFPEDQLAVRSYGRTRPEVPDETVLMKARNRRVDVLVLAPDER